MLTHSATCIDSESSGMRKHFVFQDADSFSRTPSLRLLISTDSYPPAIGWTSFSRRPQQAGKVIQPPMATVQSSPRLE